MALDGTTCTFPITDKFGWTDEDEHGIFHFRVTNFEKYVEFCPARVVGCVDATTPGEYDVTVEIL